ncbi:predicted protein [Plenodomus lingam JN3]|uniref:Predicted protein n=1 Tax=Leptosphaeria maculans (strain JN3 / isolate v23.1.3 / race Av1-4-5-6-7-8) TaxID=985895 RepID=E5ADU6_LEPMJ|nr:predicted protein [Plenodomus lingam JN3]CBY01385.1 predicted protein [Plenodomus lingam JN3]
MLAGCEIGTSPLFGSLGVGARMISPHECECPAYDISLCLRQHEHCVA